MEKIPQILIAQMNVTIFVMFVCFGEAVAICINDYIVDASIIFPFILQVIVHLDISQNFINIFAFDVCFIRNIFVTDSWLFLTKQFIPQIHLIYSFILCIVIIHWNFRNDLKESTTITHFCVKSFSGTSISVHI
eukprot:Pompholyxophrys_punicea_v1_NODE_199_length_2817_cov_7.944605.p2 type:complete len:134 gc:universal NODE_199_length_2817_cov_7.944605:1208-807(-)